MNKYISTPWIGNKTTDLLFIIGPAFFSVLLAFILNYFFPSRTGVTLVPWVILVLLIDVGHVYGSVYKTYFHPFVFKKRKPLLISIPFICFILGFLLYEFSSLFFWRMLTYLAVFHFIRQQYGIMKIYSEKGGDKKTYCWIDNITIYLATISPLVYWHTHLPRQFTWFVENDFFHNLPVEFSRYVGYVQILSLLIFLFKERLLYSEGRQINLPKILFILGTSLSWYVGIVYFNNDLIFTSTNVISHGIPYFALVWINGRDEFTSKPVLQKSFYRFFFSPRSLPLFLCLLFFFSFVEEGFWAGLIWREHLEVFPFFSHLPVIVNQHLLAILVPLLSLPQSTHYVLDGFIWRKKFNSSIE